MNKPFNESERKWAMVLFNLMAFEAAKHATSQRPIIQESTVKKIRAIGDPLCWDRRSNQGYDTNASLPNRSDNFDFCYDRLDKIRDNFIHGNKSRCVDDPVRLTALLDWAEEFIDNVNNSDSDFAREGLCCTNPVRDSSRESSVVAWMHEQTHIPHLQDQELAGL